MAINVPAIALARGVNAPDNREVLWEDTSNMNLPFYERIKSYDSNSQQWRMVTQLPLELLNELRKVDGDGSGLDANFLQGRTVNDIIQLAKDGSFTLPSGFIFVGDTLGNATARALSGDATLQPSGSLVLASTGVTAGTYNLASLTIDVKGRITNAVSYTISVSDIPELPQSKITGLVTDLSNRELLANKENSVIDTSTTKYPTVNLLKIGLDGKQNTLVSGNNIKTLNGEPILGAGNITIISENLATNNLSIPPATNRTVTIPSDSLVDFGANARFRNNVLELQSVTRGFLMNRVTTIQMNGIVGMADNELVFNTDLKAIFRYDATLLQWVALSSGYGIIAVYSGSGSGVPTFFATLQSALETCKTSGGYFTVKLYSNITITSAIEIDYTGSGVGKSYLFRQLTIDFNGFSVTNAQANTTDCLDIRLSNTASVYQEVRLINGNIIRTNGTGTHHALRVGEIGILTMSKMYIYCQNGIGALISIANSHTSQQGSAFCDFGGSAFVSLNSSALITFPNGQQICNFNATSYGAEKTVFIMSNFSFGTVSNFVATNNGSGRALEATQQHTNVSNFVARAIGEAVSCAFNATLSNFSAISSTGRAVGVGNYGTIENFTAKTGNHNALVVADEGYATNGKCFNNSSTFASAHSINSGSITGVEAINIGSGLGLQVFTNQTSVSSEFTNCKGISNGGIGGSLYTESGAVLKVHNCQFVSRWNNTGGHALRVGTSAFLPGQIQISNSNFIVRNSGANVLNATSATTVKSFGNTDNEVATTPINANVTVTTLRNF